MRKCTALLTMNRLSRSLMNTETGKLSMRVRSRLRSSANAASASLRSVMSVVLPTNPMICP